MPNTYLEGAIELKFVDNATANLKKALDDARKGINGLEKTINKVSWANVSPPTTLATDLTNLGTALNSVLPGLVQLKKVSFQKAINLPVINIPNINGLKGQIDTYNNLLASATSVMGLNRRKLNSRPLNLPDFNLPKITPDKMQNLQQYINMINKLATSMGNLMTVMPAVNQGLAQTGKGVKNLGTQKPGKEWGQWFVNMALWLPKQIAMAAIWSGIYNTIGAINQQIREGLQMYSQLEVGLGRALSTGMNKGQVQQAFTPEAQGGYEESRQKLKSLAGLQALLFTSQHKANVEEYTGALYELTSANINLEDAMKMVETSMKVSIAAGGNVEQVTRSLAGLYNVFKDRITDVSGAQAKFAQIGNTVLYVWAKEQMELSELNNALKYSANIASVMNIDYRVLVATIGHLNTQMLRGSTAGTGLRQMWNASAKNMESLVDLFGEANQGLKDFASNNNRAYDPAKPVDFIAILGDLRAQLMQGKKETDKMVFSANDLKKAFKTFDLRGSNILLTLLNSYDDLKGKIADVMGLNQNFIDQYVRLRELDPSTQLNILMKNFKAIPTAFLMGIEGKDTLAKSLEEVNKKMSVVLASAFKLGEGFQVMWGKIAENKDILITVGDTILSFMEETVKWGGLLWPIAEAITVIGGAIYYVGKLIVGIPVYAFLETIATGFSNIAQYVVNFSNIFKSEISGQIGWMEAFKKQFLNLVGLFDGSKYQKITENMFGSWAKMFGKGDKDKKKEGLQDLIKSWSQGIDTNKFLEQNTYAETFKALKESMQGPNNEMKQLDISAKTFIADLQVMIKEATDLNSKLTVTGDIQGAINASGAKYESIYDAIANSYSAKQIKNISEQLTLARQLTQAYKEVYDQQVKDYAYRANELKTPKGMRDTMKKDIDERKELYGRDKDTNEFKQQLENYTDLSRKYDELAKSQTNLKASLQSGSITQKQYNSLIKISSGTMNDLLKEMNKAPENVKGFYTALQDEKGLKDIEDKVQRIDYIKKRIKELKDQAKDMKTRSVFFVSSMGLEGYNTALNNIKTESKNLAVELTTLEKEVNNDTRTFAASLSASIEGDLKTNEDSLEKLRQRLPGLISQMKDAYKTAQDNIANDLDYPGMTPEQKQEAKLKNQQNLRLSKADNLMKDTQGTINSIQGKIDAIGATEKGAKERKEYLRAWLSQEEGAYNDLALKKIQIETENGKELLQLHIKQAQEKAQLDQQINKNYMTKQQQAMFEISHKYDSLLIYYAGNKQKENEINKLIESEKKDLTLKMAQETNDQLQKLADDRLKIAQDLADRELSLERKTNETKIYEAGVANIKRLTASGASDTTIQKAMDQFNVQMEATGKQWDQKEAGATIKQAKQEEMNLNKRKVDLEGSIKNIDARIANAQKGGNKAAVEELKLQRENIVTELDRLRVDIVNAKIKAMDARRSLAQSEMDLITMPVGEKDMGMKRFKQGVVNGSNEATTPTGQPDQQSNYKTLYGNALKMYGIYSAQGDNEKAMNAYNWMQVYSKGYNSNAAPVSNVTDTPAFTGGSPMIPIGGNGNTQMFLQPPTNGQEINSLNSLNSLNNNPLLKQEVTLKSIDNIRKNTLATINSEIDAEEKLYQKNKQTWGATLEKRNEAKPGNILNNMGRSLVNIFAPKHMTRSAYGDDRLHNLDKIRDLKGEGGKVADTIQININDGKSNKKLPQEVDNDLTRLSLSIKKHRQSIMGVA